MWMGGLACATLLVMGLWLIFRWHETLKERELERIVTDRASAFAAMDQMTADRRASAVWWRRISRRGF